MLYPLLYMFFLCCASPYLLLFGLNYLGCTVRLCGDQSWWKKRYEVAFLAEGRAASVLAAAVFSCGSPGAVTEVPKCPRG